MFILSRSASLLCVVTWSGLAQEWTEQRVVQQFLDWHPLQREMRARIALAEAETRGRTLYANPAIGFAHEGAGRTEFYQAAQALPVSGRLPILRAAGELQVRRIEAEGGFSLWQARSALRAAFYRAIAAQEQEQVLLGAVEEITKLAGLLAEREREGEGSKLDRLRAERELVALRADTGAIRARLALERGEVLAFLPPGTKLGDRLVGSLETGVAEHEVAALAARALASRADIQAERRRVEELGFEQRAAQRLRIPEPVLTAGLKRSDQGLPGVVNGPVVGVSLALPLFNQGKTEVARYSAEQERARARLDYLSRRASASVEAAWHSFAARRETLRGFDTAADEDLTRIAWVAYQEGEIGILQLLDAYKLRREARSRRADLAAAAKEAWIALEALVGEELTR